MITELRVNMKQGVSVVIPTMNRPEALKETIDSYIHGTVVPDEIIVVDQSSDVNVRSMVQNVVDEYKAGVVYIYQCVPSLTKARNTGFSHAQYSIIVMSDDDVTVQHKTIENIVDIMQDTDIAMIAGINSQDGFGKSIASYFFGKKSYIKRNIGHITKAVVGRFPETEVKGCVKTEWAMGFFFAIRKDLVEKWNLSWDEKLISYAYAEDLDFSYAYYKQACKDNKRCVLSDRVIVHHRVANEWRIPSRKSTFMYVINREYLCHKHKMGLDGELLVWWLNLGELIFRTLKRIPTKDLVDAMRTCIKNRKQIRQGILESSWYD